SSLQVRYVGYTAFQRNVLPDGQGDITVVLHLETRMADEVQVIATRAAENAATTYKNIDIEDITRGNLAQDIPYLLDQTPSVVIGSDAGAGVGYTNLTIRGSDNQRINVTLNGIPLNDAESMGSFFVN